MRARRLLVPFGSSAAALLVAPVLGMLAACSLTTSLSGLSNGPDVAPDAAIDAATTTADGSTSMSESGAGGDASAGDADATTTAFGCADHASALFCADFETGPFNANWGYTFFRNGGTLVLGAGRFGSGLVATVPARADPGVSTRPAATVETSVTLTARAPLTLAFDMNIPSAATGGGVVDIGGFDFHGPFYVVTFRMENDGTIHLHEYGDPLGSNPNLLTDAPLTAQPAIGSWVHVAMALTFPTSSSARLVVTFDGATTFDGPIGASPYASQPFVYAGINNAESAASLGRTVDVDDILVTTP